jgi:hypothetical protein
MQAYRRFLSLFWRHRHRHGLRRFAVGRVVLDGMHEPWRRDGRDLPAWMGTGAHEMRYRLAEA